MGRKPSTYLVRLAVADVSKCWIRSSQIEQRVHLHYRLGNAKRRPVEQSQTQIDDGGIQGVDRIGLIQPQVLVLIVLACTSDQRAARSLQMRQAPESLASGRVE